MSSVKAQAQLTRTGANQFAPEIWLRIFEHLRMSLQRTEYPRETPSHRRGRASRQPWIPTTITSVPLRLRLISRYHSAIVTPLAFARYYLSAQFFDAKYDGDLAAFRVRSLVRTYAQCIIIRHDLHWQPVISFLGECRALKDLEWRFWLHAFPMVQEVLLRHLSHVRLHIAYENRDYAYGPFNLDPAPNIVSLSLNSATIQNHEALRGLLRESKQLKVFHIYGDVDISSEAGQLPPIQELIVRSKRYTAHPNLHLWDFSNLQYLQIGLPDIRPMIQEVSPVDMPRIKKLTLFYMVHYSRQNELEWEDGAYTWVQAVEKFLDDRKMCQLKDLSISGIRPLHLAPTLATAAPMLKRLWLYDAAPPTMLPNYTPGNIQVLLESCPGLEVIYINLPYSLLDPDNEGMCCETFCLFEQLKDLHIRFAGVPSSNFRQEVVWNIPDSDRLTYCNRMVRVKECIMREKIGVPLHKLILEVLIDGDWESWVNYLTLDFKWSSDGEEHQTIYEGVKRTWEYNDPFSDLDYLDN